MNKTRYIIIEGEGDGDTQSGGEQSISNRVAVADLSGTESQKSSDGKVSIVANRKARNQKVSVYSVFIWRPLHMKEKRSSQLENWI